MHKYQRLNKRIDAMFEKCEIDDELLGTDISKDSISKILDYQIFHIINLITCFKKNNVVLDGSHTGTGKTYTTACLCKEMKLKPLIICPLSVINIWRSVCDYFDVHPLAIINYETIKKGRTTRKIKQNNINMLIDDNLNDEDNGNNHVFNDKYISIDEKNNYVWKLEKDSIVVFDEAHKCKHTNTQNGKLLLSLKNVKTKVLLLSATIADKPENFKIFGYMLELYSSLKKGNDWVEAIIRDDMNRLDNVSSLYEKLYPFKGSRMSLDDIGNKFPKNQISVECYTLDKKAKQNINIFYETIKKLNNNLPNLTESDLINDSTIVEHENHNSIITTILKMRQKIELMKIPIITELIDKYLENGKSIVIFVNFLETMNTISERINLINVDHVLYHGGMTENEREITINKFQTNHVRILICTIQSGSEGVSFHDTTGKAPRVSLIMPTFSSNLIIQALGRCCRSGMKSNVIQKIIFCSDTHEKLMADNMKKKLTFHTQLSENDKNKQVTLSMVDTINDLF